MRTDHSRTLSGSSNESGIDYDQVYISAWESILLRCKDALEPNDYEHALTIIDINDFKQGLDELKLKYEDEDQATRVILLLYPTLDHYERFATGFVNRMSLPVKTSMMWGLLYLVIKVALESEGAIERISEMLTAIGQKLEILNEYSQTTYLAAHLKGNSVDVHVQLMRLWLSIITFFRNNPIGALDSVAWDILDKKYNEAARSIDEKVANLGKLASAIQSQHHDEELSSFQSLYINNRQGYDAEEARLPCYALPLSMNTKFYGRQELLQAIDDSLQPELSVPKLRAFALHGLGGQGKSQVALEYAYRKSSAVRAVIWIPSETPVAMSQAFSALATEHLRLPGAEKGNDQENRVLVLTWLQRTKAKWLLIFDNVESSQLLTEYWPVGNAGAILITTRHRALAFQPASTGAEIPPFSDDEGGKFLFHLISNPQADKKERDSALALSKRLGGHALGITQMAALIYSRGWSCEKFINIYDKQPRRTHRMKDQTWMHGGYHHSLDTVWLLSFESLSPDATLLLGILSMLSPDSIPLSIFEIGNNEDILPQLDFVKDEITFSDVIKELCDLALIRKDPMTSELSMHRLVQAEFQYHMQPSQRNIALQGGYQLLHIAFPKTVHGRMYNSWSTCQIYLEHVLALAAVFTTYIADIKFPIGDRRFCQLLCNCARFCYERGFQSEQSIVLDTASKAFEQYPDNVSRDNELVLAIIQNAAGQMYLEIGKMDLARKNLVQACELRLKNLPSNSEEVAICDNNLGIMYNCAQEYFSALKYAEQCLNIRIEYGKDWGNAIGIAHSNLGRVYASLGRYAEAEEQYGKCLDFYAKRSGDKHWFLKTDDYYMYGDLYLAQGDVVKAKENYEKARHFSIDVGNSSTDPLAAATLYKLGRLALRENDDKAAIKYLRHSLFICELNKSVINIPARTSFLLSKALLLSPDPETRAEGEVRRLQAMHLRQTIEGERYDEKDQSEEAYDRLMSWYEYR